jgi:hypothetical protein
MVYDTWSDQIPYHVQPRSNDQPGRFFNHRTGFRQGEYNGRPEHNNQNRYNTERRGAVAYYPGIHSEHAQTYPATSLTGPMDPQSGPYLGRHEDYQQHSVSHSDDSQAGAFVMMGPPVLQPFPAMAPAYQQPGATAQSDPPYIRPTYSKAQHDLPVGRGAPHGWYSGPAPGQFNGQPESSYQRGGQMQHPMGQLTTPYGMPQARYGSLQHMQVPPREMYGQRSTSLPTFLSNVPLQSLGTNVFYNAGPPPVPQPPMKIPSGPSNDTVGSISRGRGNVVHPGPIAHRETTLSKKTRKR